MEANSLADAIGGGKPYAIMACLVGVRGAQSKKKWAITPPMNACGLDNRDQPSIMAGKTFHE